MAPEQHALGGQRVGVRRFDNRMAGRRQAIAAPLVACDEKDVRAAWSVVQSCSS
jgi:hypothetical protein